MLGSWCWAFDCLVGCVVVAVMVGVWSVLVSWWSWVSVAYDSADSAGADGSASE